MRFYRDGGPSGEEIARWHWATCHGVIGYEQLAVETVALTGSEQPTRFIVDLSTRNA